MTSEEKEITIFMLQAIEKLSWAILTGKYDTEEMNNIYQDAQINLVTLIRD